ncbi:MAG: hypothetical protein QXU18_09540 [Thermoplasmatales archaeon]
MSAIKKIVKISKKEGSRAIWNDSDVKYDIHLTADSKEANTYVIKADLLKGRIKQKHLDPNYLYKSVKPKILMKLHQKNLVILFNNEGRALAIKKIKNINIGIYQKREINKMLTMNEPAFVRLYKEVEQTTTNNS